MIVLLGAGYLYGMPWIPQTGLGLARQYRVDLEVYRFGARAWLDGAPLYRPGFR